MSRTPKVLICFESSGVVRDAFIRRGFRAISCDLLPSESEFGPHVQGDVFDFLGSHKARGADLLIAHPPCTYLTTSAAWAFKDIQTKKLKPGTLTGAKRRAARTRALRVVERIQRAKPNHIALENPKGYISTYIRKADQYIQPYQFGHDASKGTGLWLKNLPRLLPTEHVPGRWCCRCGHSWVDDPGSVLGRWGCPVCNGEGGPAYERWANQTDTGQNRLGPSADRWKERSRTYLGIAEAMADQWGAVL